MNSPWSDRDVRQATELPLSKALDDVCDYEPRDMGAGSRYCEAVQKQPKQIQRDRAVGV